MTKQITVGPVKIGGGAPVSIQSMLNTRTTDVEVSLRQIRELAAAGCEIARLAVYDQDAAAAFGKICGASPLPLVADIHFDYRLAIAAAEHGADKIRINPGNIGGEERVRAVVEACGARSLTASGRTIFQSASASTAEVWKKTSCRNTGTPRRRRWSKAHFPTSGCWKNSASMISACR